MNYKPIELADSAIIQSFTLTSSARACDLSWSNLCSWGSLFHPEYRVMGNYLLIRFRAERGLFYMMPIGRNECAIQEAPKSGVQMTQGTVQDTIVREDLLTMLDTISMECRAEGCKLLLLGVLDCHLPILRQWRPEGLIIQEDRNRSDYLYLRTSLASLTGKALQPKRNHINKFLKTYADWTYEPIEKSNIQDCLEMERLWCIANGCDKNNGMEQERQAVLFALHHFEELGLLGGLLRVERRIVAFTFGMPINADTFGVHVEKANSEIEGSYALINREFARNVPEQFVYLNREEDLGIEGLRRAKLSYKPEIILSKYRVEEL